MPFFKRYNGTTNQRLLRVERTIWTLIYGGLLAMVLGYFVETTQGGDASSFYALGVLALALGVALVFLRSRMADKQD